MADNKASKSKDKNQHIQVFVRVRPINNIEKNCKSYSVVETGNKEVVVKERPVEKITKTFTFDKVFGPESKQIDVYKAVVNPLIEEVLAGYNCTVFAYGQTGTGKTFTMEGERVNDPTVSWDNDPLSGIIPRTLSHLFDELRTLQAEYTVRVSFLELYNEELFDLLSPTDDTSKIKLFEDSNKKGSVIISGLEEVTVHNKNEVYKIMEMGSIKRQTAATLMNAQSSRSHTVFSITVHIRDNNVDGEELLKTGKLNLVDLAGSENVGRSGAVDKRAREAGNINQSLLTLGRCITSLVERAPHIPYRESKLTRLLQDSLGGRTKTSIIATISPAACNLEETLSTLDYAHRAKNITNRPEINQKLTKKALLKEYTEEIERLRRDVQAARDKNGIYLANDNYTEMILKLEHQDQEIISKLANIKALTEDMEKKEALCQQLNIRLEQRTEELLVATEVLEQTRSTLTHTEMKLKDTQQERDEEHHLVEQHVVTEKKLGKRARQLLTVADQSSTDTYKLHDKLDRKRSVENSNSQISRDFRIAFQQKLVHMEENVGQFTQEQEKFWTDLQNKFALHLQKGSSGLSQVSEQMSSLVSSLDQLIQDFNKQTSDQAHSSQQWGQQHLSTARSRSDSQESSLHQFQTELMPIMQGLARQLLTVQADIQEHKRNTMQELPYLLDMIVEHEAKETARLNQLREITVQLVQQHQINIEHSQVLMNSLKQVKDVHSDDVIDALSKALEQIKSGKANTNQMLTELSSAYSQAIENSKHVVETVTDGLHREIKYVNELRTNYETHSNELRGNLVNTLEHSSSALTDANRFQIELERGVNEFVTNSEKVLKEDCQWVDKDVRKHLESVNGQFLVQQDSFQGLLGMVRTSAHLHETTLEHERAELSAFARTGQSDVELHCSYVNDWHHQNTVELRQRDQDLDKFLSEDLCRDNPTGMTPQRRDFKYERDLVATSPHERILARYRERHNQAMAEQAKHDSSSETFVSIEDAEPISPPSDDSDNQFLGANVPKAASTNDLLNLDKLDLDSSFSSEPGFIKRENKENGKSLFAPPTKTKKHHQTAGGLMKKPSMATADIKAPLRKVLSAHNQH